MANDDEHRGPFAQTWTFCSSMGVKRRINFVLWSASLRLVTSHVSCCSDIGSDHLSVRAKCQIGKTKINRVSKPRAKRGWKPHLERQGWPMSYHHLLSDALQDSLENLWMFCKQSVLILVVASREEKKQLHETHFSA